MFRRILFRAAEPILMLSLAILPVACGGGGTGPVASAPAVPPPAVPPPAWRPAVDLEATGYVSGAALAGDGKGGVIAAWIRTGLDAGGTAYWEQVATRLRPEGTWESLLTLERTSLSDVLQAPVAALDDQGKGLVAWFSALPRSTITALRTMPVDLSAASIFGTRVNGLTLDLRTPGNLALAVGSDGSALAAWTFTRDIGWGVFTPAVFASRRNPTGGWSAPRGYQLNQLSHQNLQGVSGNNRGAFLLEFSTGDDAWEENQVASFASGSDVGVAVPGWMPTTQIALPAGRISAIAGDGLGGLETFLLYSMSGEGDAQRQAWPRSCPSTGQWTVGGKVALPLPTNNLVAFREATGTGWLAGLGSQGLWVAPLTGVTPGPPRALLPATTTTEVLIGARDSAGRPALLWVQRGTGGTDEGIGFSRWDGAAWTAPVILPGTEGRSIQRLFATAGPSGLMAGWVDATTSTLRFRTALWK